MEKFLSTNELAKEFNMSRSFIYKCTSGRKLLPHYKIAGKLYFLKSEIHKKILDSKVESIEDCVFTSHFKL